MGVTIHYRGTLDRRGSIEDIQDRVFDLALALGGRARYWYSRGKGPRGRTVRGLLLDLAPGCDTVGLLFSEEGRLVPLLAIKEAERAAIPPDTWIFVKTQFAPVEAHVALIALLRFLKERYASDLVVEDEGGYWASGALEPLLRARGTIARGLDLLEEGLRDHPLTAEAAEDVEIVAARVESIARVVNETLRRAPEHPPVRFGEGEEDDEALWDAALKENARRVERLVERIDREGTRVLEEMAPVGQSVADWESEEETEELPPTPRRRRKHPLLRRTERLYLSLPEVEGVAAGLLEAMGGFVQALHDEEWEVSRGLAIAQLKRALRGLALARGGLHLAKDAGALDEARVLRAGEEIDALVEGTLERMRALREKRS